MVFRSWLRCWAWTYPERSVGSHWIATFISLVFAAVSMSSLPAHAERQLIGHAPGMAPDLAAISPRIARIQDLIPDWRQHCVNIRDGAATTPEQQSLKLAINTLGRSELGAWLIDQAAKHSVMVCLDGRTGLEAYYRAHLHLIGLNDRLSPAGHLVFLAHELAHVPQHPRFSNNRRFSPQDMLLLHRVREATAEAVATRALWQLRELGQDTAWQEKLRTAYGDIAKLFHAHIGQKRGAAAELQATRSAFYHWFEADWRLDIYDDLMLKTLARIADDPIGLLPSSRWLSDRYLREISHYAGDRFLFEGDGRALMTTFGLDWLASGNQAELDAMMGQAALHQSEARREEIPSLEGASGLSASSSRPIQ